MFRNWHILHAFAVLAARVCVGSYVDAEGSKQHSRIHFHSLELTMADDGYVRFPVCCD